MQAACRAASHNLAWHAITRFAELELLPEQCWLFHYVSDVARPSSAWSFMTSKPRLHSGWLTGLLQGCVPLLGCQHGQASSAATYSLLGSQKG